MMSLLPAASSSTMLLVDPAGPEACGGTALHVRLLGHGHGGVVDQRSKTDR